MKKATLVTMIIAAAMVLGCTPLLMAQGPGDCDGGPCMKRGGGKGGPGFLSPRIARMLDLSDEQKEQLKELRTQFKEQNSDLREQMKAKREEMRTLWNVETPDKEAILAKHAEMDPLRAQMRERHVDQRLAMLAVLTPEQRKTMSEKMEKLAEFRKEFGPKADRGGRGHGRRGKGRRGMRGDF